MAYIRQKAEELTGYQNGLPWQEIIDLECDFVMVYRINGSTGERLRQYQEKGYVVHMMTGISWGQYQDYLEGKWDQRNHEEEGQVERGGKPIIHGPGVPYIVPTVSFSDYLVEKLKPVVDMGVEAIHMEEPEFWDRGGYSEAFKREYEIYYKEPWKPQHEDLDAHYKAAKLKAYLYARTINRVSAGLKEYAKAVYGRNLRFYVPTHSLLNYLQWKIISPESALLDIPTVDGYIAQVWTGTSRTPNVYEGVCRERTFENAYLEYGAMQELTRGTDRRMWFLHDPIEDNPIFTWENYRYNYIKTAVASLLHPYVWHYEICPWPDRVFSGVYPRYQPNIEQRDESSYAVEGAKPIPPDYATLLSGMFQMFGDMEQEEIRFEGVNEGVGVLISDSGLFQRSYPDGFGRGEAFERWSLQKGRRMEDGSLEEDFIASYMEKVKSDASLLPDFTQSVLFPNFYGMAMPLLKYGLPVKPVQLDNVRRFAGYLDDCRLLILSYEYIKPESPDINASLIAWVRRGGTLCYIGNGKDPYHEISLWWRKAGYDNPAMHLFELAELERMPEDGTYAVGKGRIIVWNLFPAKICLFRELARKYRGMVKGALADQGIFWEYRNDLTLYRGPYVVSAVMDESCGDESKVFEGLYADMLENDYRIIRRKEISPDESTILFDFSRIQGERFRVIGTSARVLSADLEEGKAVLRLKTADKIKAFTRVRLPGRAVEVEAVKAGSEGMLSEAVSWQWDEETETLLLAYDSTDQEVVVTVRLES